MRQRARPAFLFWILLLGAGAAAAQLNAPRPGPPGPEGEPTIMLDFEDVDITDVIQVIAELTGKNFLYDERVRGRVTVISPHAVGLEEAYRVFESMLNIKGFTTVEGPSGILKVMPTREAKAGSLDGIEDRWIPNRDLYVTRLIPLDFVEVDLVRSTIQPLMSPDANMVAYAPTNTLILSDTAANVRRLLSIIRAIDVETHQQQIRIIPLEYADAGTMAGHLQQIFEDPKGGPPGRAATTPARARRAAQAAAAAAANQGVIGEAGAPRFITDDRTNSLIVIATAAQLQQIQDLILLLDYERQGSGRLHVHRLQNADAEEMAATLASLVGTAPGRPSAAGAKGQSATVAELEEGMKVTADAPTNSLIIQASAEGYGMLRGVIEALDTRRPQVMVEALIMDVIVNDDTELGMGFIFNTLLGGAGTLSLATSAPAGFPVTGGKIGSLTTAILSDSSVNGESVIQGLITASAKNADANIISAPIILTADNESAEIVVATNIPIPTGSVTTPSGTGTTSGGFNTSTTFSRQDVGVTLRVTPQISEGDMIRLEVFQEVSRILPQNEQRSANTNAGTNAGVSTAKRSVDNVVFVKDGEAVMIGGILDDNQLESISKVPFLGDIPILGWAFKSKTLTTIKQNLLVVLSPRIVRHPDDLRQLTIENRERFREFSAASLQRDEKERQARQAALRAGLDLPQDPNPVRRNIETLERRYPVGDLPKLREESLTRERERLAEMAARSGIEGARYVIQVAEFEDPAAAVALLESLIASGFDGTLYSRPGPAGVRHLVQLGPFVELEDAERAAREVQVETGMAPSVLVEP